MPQFDVSSFVVQLLSLGIFFLGFYFLFSFKYLPNAAFLLKARTKSASFNFDEVVSFPTYDIKA